MVRSMRHDLAPARRQVGHLRGGQRFGAGMFGTVGLHLRGLPDDADGLRHFADLQRDVAQRHALVGGNRTLRGVREP